MAPPMSHGVRTPPLPPNRSVRAAQRPSGPAVGRGRRRCAGAGSGDIGVHVDGRADRVAGRTGERRGADGCRRDDEPERPVGVRSAGGAAAAAGSMAGSGLGGSAASTAAAPRPRPSRPRPAPPSPAADRRRRRPPSPTSYSATDAKTGSPADAASARVAGSPATIDSRLSWVSASRASSRKLIRDVATREPYGRTTAIRAASEPRMRAAADVISSSTSR